MPPFDIDGKEPDFCFHQYSLLLPIIGLENGNSDSLLNYSCGLPGESRTCMQVVITIKWYRSRQGDAKYLRQEKECPCDLFIIIIII